MIDGSPLYNMKIHLAIIEHNAEGLIRLNNKISYMSFCQNTLVKLGLFDGRYPDGAASDYPDNDRGTHQ